MERLKSRSAHLKAENHALSIAFRDAPQRHAKALIAFILAYALSPIDLIPDSIPVLGALDDLLIVPAGVLSETQMKVTQAKGDSKIKG
jgi:uncharacterized membrane protein YkvA (DUF1232 family)